MKIENQKLRCLSKWGQAAGSFHQLDIHKFLCRNFDHSSIYQMDVPNLKWIYPRRLTKPLFHQILLHRLITKNEIIRTGSIYE